jgi:hypothetical protein
MLDDSAASEPLALMVRIVGSRRVLYEQTNPLHQCRRQYLQREYIGDFVDGTQGGTGLVL